LNKFTVQVASQGSQTEAEKKVEELKEKGLSAMIIPVELKNKKWYRVVVGTFDDRNSAIAYLNQVKKQNGIESAIVQKIGK